MSDDRSGERKRDDREATLLDAFVHLSDTLVDDYDIIEFLHFLTERCVELTDVDEAGVMLVTPVGRLHAVASSSERSHLLELFELQNHDGPCLDAFRDGAVVSSPALEMEVERWPTFAPQALSVGFRSVHSIPLRLRQEVIGAMNLLRIAPGSLGPVDARLARAMSDVATVGILQERSITNSASSASGLQNALASRIRIEQAKGVLAERAGITIDEAFQTLRSYAKDTNSGLTVSATGLVNREIEIPAPNRATD